MLEELCSGGIIYRKIKKETEILFILDPYNKWAFPKGHIEQEETKIGAAVREVSEETGIEIKDLRIKKYLGDTKYSFKDKNGQEINKTVHFFLIKLLKPKTKLIPQEDDSIKAIKWVNIQEASQVSDYDNVDEVLKKVTEIFQNK
jgi:tRNA nucleotidyltransferase (CCA-adding enzyme)